MFNDVYLKDSLDKALRLALTDNPAPVPVLKNTTRRTITRRGVIWLGQTCNLHCEFCYFIDKIHSGDHPEHAFMSLDKAKKICRTLVDFYKNNAIDIQGGEPSIYKDIFSLVAYCRGIGLTPTLITNGLVLESVETCRRYKDAGIRDFLVSIHGLVDSHDRIVGLRGAFERQMKAINNLLKTGIPFRFNCVLSKSVVEQLPLVAEFAIKAGVRIINFIAFNPFEDQARKGRRRLSNVPRYSEIRGNLTEALDMLDKAEVEANVRYFPICMLEERHRKSAYNFRQLSYDHHEWDYASWSWTGLQPQRMREGDLSEPSVPSTSRTMLYIKNPMKKLAGISFLKPILYRAHAAASNISSLNEDSGKKDELYRKIAALHAEVHCKYTYSDRCRLCMAKDICDGFHGDYAEIFSAEEAAPIEGISKITDPAYYIGKQQKYVEKEDETWAI